MAKRRFDQSGNRVDYGELLSADADYELDQAVGLTYSLDMEALMGIPLCLGMHGEMTSGQKNNPLYVLEAIRRTGKKLSVFCNTGCIKVPKSESRLFALLEDSIHEVRMPNKKYNFHPKLWVLQYHNINTKQIIIKLVTLSRNLTFDQSIDIAAELTGFVGDSENIKNQPIADMLQFVSQFDSNKNKYNQLISNVKKVKSFNLSDCFNDYAFHAFGIYGKTENRIKKIYTKEHIKSAGEIFNNCSALFIVSPFLSEGVVTELMGAEKNTYYNGPTKRCLITREASVTNRIFNAFNSNGSNEDAGVWVINPVFGSNDALEDISDYGVESRDLHAKIYYTEKYKEPHKLYLGSLNASYNAFNNNVEFLLELTYKNYYSSFDSIKADFLPQNDCPFVPLAEFDEANVIKSENTVDFQNEIYCIKSAEVISKNGKFTIKVYSEADFSDVTIRPFFLKACIKPLTKEVEFCDVAINYLSNMFVLTKLGIECLVKLEVSGLPSQEREAAIFNDIINDRPMFMTYMRYLLDEDFYDGVNFEDYILKNNKADEYSVNYGLNTQPDIYEKMLRAAADYPQRFDSMYEIVKKLEDNKIGDEFKQLLELFMKASGRKAKGCK